MLKRIINVFPFKANELTSFMYETGHEKNNAIFEDNKTPKGADGTVFLFFAYSIVWFGLDFFLTSRQQFFSHVLTEPPLPGY